jgi:SAM-dependent methyltransferase
MTRGDKRLRTPAEFDRAHAVRLQSPTLERLWQDAYGADYPEQVQPNAFYSLSTLRHLGDALKLRAGHTLVDLGCGHGGAGLWVAQQHGAQLIGLDISRVGVELAASRTAELGLADRFRFRVADMVDTGLPDASCDGAISLDVLLFVADKAAAIKEAARILRPGARFAITTWEQPGYSERLNSHQLADYCPTLQAGGFDVELYGEPQGWRVQQRALLEAAVAHERDLIQDMGDAAATAFVGMARASLADMPLRRYVFAVGQRK